jgi:hypothetical protein
MMNLIQTIPDVAITLAEFWIKLIRFWNEIKRSMLFQQKETLAAMESEQRAALKRSLGIS